LKIKFVSLFAPNESCQNNGEELYWFCDSHAKPFKMGMSLGQLEINSKFLSFLSDLPESEFKEEIKKNIRQFTPFSKVSNHTGDLLRRDSGMSAPEIHTPKQLYDMIGQTVIGQEEARKAISVSVINHLQFLDEQIHAHQL
jgi:hypothetical protein